MTSTSAYCPLCGKTDSIYYIALRCPNPTMCGMHTNRHHAGLSSCVKALSKGRYGSSLTAMDACQNQRLLKQGIEVPDNISQTLPGWLFLLALAPLPGTKAALMLQRAKPLASKLSCHAIQRITTILNRMHALHFQGNSGGGFAGRVAEESRRRRVRVSRSMADNSPDPH
eukprot:1148044-Pelagomonas_calceolata.AAC.7